MNPSAFWLERRETMANTDDVHDWDDDAANDQGNIETGS